MFRDIERNRWVLDAYLHSNAVILGSVLSDYYQVDERNYNLASGFSIKGGANMVFNRDKFSASLSHAYYRLFTWKGYHQYSDLDNISYKVLDAQGDHSVASFIVTEARCDPQVVAQVLSHAVVYPLHAFDPLPRLRPHKVVVNGHPPNADLQAITVHGVNKYRGTVAKSRFLCNFRLLHKQIFNYIRYLCISICVKNEKNDNIVGNGSHRCRHDRTSQCAPKSTVICRAAH